MEGSFEMEDNELERSGGSEEGRVSEDKEDGWELIWSVRFFLSKQIGGLMNDLWRK